MNLRKYIVFTGFAVAAFFSHLFSQEETAATSGTNSTVVIEEKLFNLFGSAKRVKAEGAKDGYAVKYVNDTVAWNIQFHFKNNLDKFEEDTVYNVYARAKINIAEMGQTKLGELNLYDGEKKRVTGQRPLYIQDFKQDTWRMLNVGKVLIKEGNYFYAKGTGYKEQVPEFYIDHLIFRVNPEETHRYTQKLKGFYPHLYSFSPNGDTFNDELQINIEDVKALQRINITVYNERGVRIRKLLDDEPLGNEDVHVYKWDGKDDRGNIVSDGTYKVKFRMDPQPIFGIETVFGEIKIGGKGGVDEREFTVNVNTDFNADEVNPSYDLDTHFTIGTWFDTVGGPLQSDSEANDYYNWALKDMKELGLNTAVLFGGQQEERLLRLAEEGGYDFKFFLWAPDFKKKINGFDEQGAIKLLKKEMVEPYKDYPNFYGYQNYDEPHSGEEMRQLEFYKKIMNYVDPKRLVQTVLVGIDMVMKWNEIVDSELLFVDHYPYLEGTKEGETGKFLCVRDQQYQKEFEQGMKFIADINGDKPTHYFAQAFSTAPTFAGGWDWRYPTSAEVKYQVYTALASGIKGIYYFMYQDYNSPEMIKGIVKDIPNKERRALWDPIQEINQNILNHEMLWLKGTLIADSAASSENKDIRLVDFSYNDEYYVMVINRNLLSEVTDTVRLSRAATGLYDEFGEREIEYGDGKFKITLKPGDAAFIKLLRE